MKYVLLLCMIATSVATAQDVHFTHFYEAPLQENPARTGEITEGESWKLRLGGNFRSQWWSIPVPYVTSSMYVDGKLFQGLLSKAWFGAGFHLVNDFSGDARLTMNKLCGSGAFHFPLSSQGNLYASVGVTLMGVFKRVDQAKLLYDNQWDQDGRIFNSSFDPGEALIIENLKYFNLQPGIAVTYMVPAKIRWQIGTSIDHLTRPTETFLVLGTNRVQHRYIAHTNFDIYVGRNLTIKPAFQYQFQRKAHEFVANVNIAFKRDLNSSDDLRIYTGLSLRMYFESMPPDALYPLVGAEWKRVRILLSYGFNLSELIEGTQSQGAVEISLVRIMNWKGKGGSDQNCPQFKREVIMPTWK